MTCLQKRHSAMAEWDSRESIMPQVAQKTAEVWKGTRFYVILLIILAL